MIETVRSLEVNEQVEFLGREVERRVFVGKAEILGEPERVWLKGLMEKRGLDFSDIEGKADLSEQAETVFKRMTGEKMAGLMRQIVVDLMKSQGGGVFGKDNEVPGDADQMVGDFVEKYVRRLPDIDFSFDPKKYKGDGTPGSDWQLNSIYRIEAAFAVINKLMWIMAGETEEEGSRRQVTNGIGKHLRERVMRGGEKAGDKIEATTRYEEGKILRYLPKKGLSVILKHMVSS